MATPSVHAGIFNHHHADVLRICGRQMGAEAAKKLIFALAGLLCGVSSIYFSSLQALTAATIALLWALFCDWFDGPVARGMTNRTDVDRAFGGQLDSLADLVCGGIAPAMLLLSSSGFAPWFLPGAFVLTVAGAIRLAHFNVFDDDDTYTGLPIDTNIVVVTALFPFRELLGHVAFSWVLFAAIVTLAILNVAPFRMPKLVGGWYYVVAAYVVVMTAVNISSLVR